MESGENLNTDIDNDNTNFETANSWESLMYDESESMAAFAAHALQKAKARERIEQDQKHSEPETPYKQQHKRIEQNLGHIGTSILDLRDKTTDKQAIRQESRDYGVDSLDELDDIDYTYEQILSAKQVFKKFSGLFAFLDEDTKGNPNVIEKYQQITDKKERLRFILSSSLSDKVRLFCSENFDYPNYDNFMHRLQFQQDFINGTAKVWSREWDERKSKYIDVQKPLDSSNADPESMTLGLKRDALYSAMIGSPELASVKIATARINDSRPEDRRIGEAVCLHGFESGIDRWGNSSIGQWADLCDEYKIAFDKINFAYEDGSPEQKEFKAVRELATWITGAVDYNGQIKDSESPYCASFKEAIAAGRLSYGVMRQFRGMRRNIQRSDLHNIERFIGKSGYSQKRGSMESERSRLGNRLDYIDKLSDDAKQEFLDKENAFEIKKQREWQKKELDRIQHKYDKLIGKTRSEERRTIYEQRRQEELQKTEQDVSERLAYFENRTMSGLITNINSRIELLSHRIEKRKSLAEKAIELHFRLDVGRKTWDDNSEEYIYVDSSKYRDCIDWINDAPFGVIKRAHQRMMSGMRTDAVYEMAIVETLRKTVNDPDSITSIPGNGDDIREILKLAGKLSGHSEEISYTELIEMSKKDTRWIEESLSEFPLSDVKKFIDCGLNLSLVPKLSRIAMQYGYSLNTDQLIELSSHGIINSYYYKEVERVFSSALHNFSLEEVTEAMSANIDLKMLNAAKTTLSKQEEDPSFTDIEKLASQLTNCSQYGSHFYWHAGEKAEGVIKEFDSCVKKYGYQEALKMVENDVPEDVIEMISGLFPELRNSSWNDKISLSKKILDSIPSLNYYVRDESAGIEHLRQNDYTDEQIMQLYDDKISCEYFSSVFGKWNDDEERYILSNRFDFETMKDIIKCSPRYANGSYIRNALENLSNPDVESCISSQADIVKVGNLRNTLVDEGYSSIASIEDVIRLVSNNLSIEEVTRAFSAGFSADEIIMYPFLCSKLLKESK